MRTVLAERGVDLTSVPNATMDRLGGIVCHTMRQLVPVRPVDEANEAVVIAAALNIPPMEGAWLAGAFVGAYCPEVSP